MSILPNSRLTFLEFLVLPPNSISMTEKMACLSMEISMWELAEIISGILGDFEISRAISTEKDYLTDNPQRRCPVIDRAKDELGYMPQVQIKEGLVRIVNWYTQVYFTNI